MYKRFAEFADADLVVVVDLVVKEQVDAAMSGEFVVAVALWDVVVVVVVVVAVFLAVVELEVLVAVLAVR